MSNYKLDALIAAKSGTRPVIQLRRSAQYPEGVPACMLRGPMIVDPLMPFSPTSDFMAARGLLEALTKVGTVSLERALGGDGYICTLEPPGMARRKRLAGNSPEEAISAVFAQVAGSIPEGGTIDAAFDDLVASGAIMMAPAYMHDALRQVQERLLQFKETGDEAVFTDGQLLAVAVWGLNTERGAPEERAGLYGILSILNNPDQKATSALCEELLAEVKFGLKKSSAAKVAP